MISTRGARKLRRYVLHKRTLKREWERYERERAEAIAASSDRWQLRG